MFDMNKKLFKYLGLIIAGAIIPASTNAQFAASANAQSTNYYYYMVAKHSGKCAQVNGVSKSNGAVISQWDCVNQDNVKWYFVQG